MPYRRYEIGKVFRDGPVKRGRLREFTQCDADVAGTEGPEAEAELIRLASDVFRELGIDIVIRWNNRRFLGDVLGGFGISEETALSVMLTLDKLDKIGVDGVANELRARSTNTPERLPGEQPLEPEAVEGLVRLFREGIPDFEALVERFAIAGSAGTTEVQKLMALLRETGLERICRFDPFLSRGLSFYTGTVYEIFAADGSYRSSLGSGGRYDAIIGKLVGREDVRYSAVGMSFGLDSIMELLRAGETGIDAPAVRFVPIGDTISETLRAASLFRAAGIPARVESGSRKLKRTLAAAAAKGVRFIVMIGAEEAAASLVRLKDMQTGEETVGPAELALHIVERTEGG